MTETACCERCGADATGPSETDGPSGWTARVRKHLATVAMLLLGAAVGAVVAGVGSTDAVLALAVGAAAMSWVGGCDCESC